MSVKIIAAVGKNRELGKDGDLCFHIKNDMKFFRETTTGNAVIMGRKTFESMGSKPLKNRENFVVSRRNFEVPEDVKLVSEPEKIFEKFKNSDEILFAIGGASIYEMAIPFADEIILTEIEADADADVYFPEFNKNEFSKTILEKGKENDLVYSFVKYKRK